MSFTQPLFKKNWGYEIILAYLDDKIVSLFITSAGRLCNGSMSLSVSLFKNNFKHCGRIFKKC